MATIATRAADRTPAVVRLALLALIGLLLPVRPEEDHEGPASAAGEGQAAIGALIVLAEGGLLNKTILRHGAGDLPPSDGTHTMILHYTGTLTDGTVFDSSRKRGKPFEFTLGAGQVVRGWDEGVATMRRGEKAVLDCAPEYGYGAKGGGRLIPPNATLQFEVELLDWKALSTALHGEYKKALRDLLGAAGAHAPALRGSVPPGVLKPFVEASRCAVGELSAGAVWKLRNGACNTARPDSGGEAWAAWRQQLRRSAAAVANEMANPTAFLDAFAALGYTQSPGEGAEFYKRVDGSISRSRIRALYEEDSALPPPIWADIAPTRAKAVDSYASLLGAVRSPSFQREYWERRPLFFSRSKERAQRLNRDGAADVADVLPPLVPSQRWWGDTLIGFQTDALRATFGSPPPPPAPDAGTATEPEPSASKGPTPLDDVTQHYLEEEKHRKQVEGGELLCWPCCKKPEPCSTCSDTWPCWESELEQEDSRRGGFVYGMPSEQWHHRTASAYQGPHIA